MTHCPHCSGTSYSFKDYGIIFHYQGVFGEGQTQEEVSDITHSRAAPVYCKCDGCGQKFKLKDVR